MVAKVKDAPPAFHIGWEWLAVGLCIVIVGARRSLLIGLVVAAATISALRALGVALLP
jgi:hypothetical protein